MANQVVPQEAPAGKDWEERLYQEGCALLQEEATRLLKRLDDWLLERSPSGWKVVGFRKRTVVCRFGAVTISRRLHQDNAGNYRFLLDEHVQWEAYQAAPPSVGETAVSLAAVTSFREAAAILEKVTAGVLSSTTVHQLVQKTAERVKDEKRQEVEACYGRGEMPLGGKRVVPRLFLEADGLYVRLQREKRKYGEIRMAIGYEGWEKGCPRPRSGIDWWARGCIARGVKRQISGKGPSWPLVGSGIRARSHRWFLTGMGRGGLIRGWSLLREQYASWTGFTWRGPAVTREGKRGQYCARPCGKVIGRKPVRYSARFHRPRKREEPEPGWRK